MTYNISIDADARAKLEAARAVDTAARRLRGDDAHGGRSTPRGTLWRLNFPTKQEVERARERGALLTAEDRAAAAAAAAERQGPSKFVGVTWDKHVTCSTLSWRAEISNAGRTQSLGRFEDELEAARAFDTAARQLRGDDAHGGRSCNKAPRWRLNFPTKQEVERARERGALLTAEDRAAAAAAADRQEPSKFVGVHWCKSERKWKACLSHGGTKRRLGQFDDELKAARAVDTAARRLRGNDAHGGRAGNRWTRLNFPTQREVTRARALGLPECPPV